MTKRKTRPKERTIHTAIAELLGWAAPRHVLWWHTPNGEKRDAKTGALLKAMGVKPGVPDFLLYDTHTGYLHCIEVKRAAEYLSDAQRGWKTRFDVSPTGRYGVARSVDDVAQMLQEWWPKSAKAGTFLPGGAFVPHAEPQPQEAQIADAPQD